jgi:ring-1,2-phenylacetyl-CoA epoxidase subunit PaaC
MTDHEIDHEIDHDNAYAGLLGSDSSQWAFGQDFEDPLAGVDTTVPAGLDAADLAAYCLFLGDDALVMSNRLSEWCSNAPDLEDDIALANIALDLLGQARLLLSRAAAADPSVVPALPEGSPVPAEDALAFFREAQDFRNVRFTELANGDFGRTVARLLLFSSARLAAFERLASHPDPVLSAIAAKGVKELAYHRDYAARWFVTLAQGTEESRRRVVAGLTAVWPLLDELVAAYDTGDDVGAGAEQGVLDQVLDQVLAAAGVDRPQVGAMAGHGHTEALSRMLAEMQVVARAHPMGLW